MPAVVVPACLRGDGRPHALLQLPGQRPAEVQQGHPAQHRCVGVTVGVVSGEDVLQVFDNFDILFYFMSTCS